MREANLLLKLVCATLLVGAAGSRVLAAGGGDDSDKTPSHATAREATNMKVARFDEALLTALAGRGAAPGAMCDGRDPVARRTR